MGTLIWIQVPLLTSATSFGGCLARTTQPMSAMTASPAPSDVTSLRFRPEDSATGGGGDGASPGAQYVGGSCLSGVSPRSTPRGYVAPRLLP